MSAAVLLAVHEPTTHTFLERHLTDDGFAVVKAEAPDDERVTVTFAPNRARDVPLYVAGLPIFSKAYYATRTFVSFHQA